MVAGPFMVHLAGEHDAGAVIQMAPAFGASQVFTGPAPSPHASWSNSALTWLIPLVVLGIPPILVNAYERGSRGRSRPQGRGRRRGHDRLAAGAAARGAGSAPAHHRRVAHRGDLHHVDGDDRRLHRPWRS